VPAIYLKIHMSGEVHMMMLSCEDTSREVRMFHAHTWGLLWERRFIVFGSCVLDYGWGGP